ncbi:MAG: SusF/SusE family outer membrane protein, partial [Bacteroidota bacterium]
EIELSQGDLFRFSEGPFFMGDNWGDTDADGIAEPFGENIEFADAGAFYSVTFNDESLEYTIEFVRFPSIGIIGSATPGGWDSDTDLTDNGDGTFSLLMSLTDGEAKFRQNDDWAVNWGGSDFPSGIATQDGPNIPVTAGLYEVIFNPTTGEYSFESNLNIGIIGDATPGGWDADTEMTNNGDGTYSLLAGLKDGLLKFRTVGDWTTNWGASDFPMGTGVQDGDNIPIPAGVYNITFNAGTGEYNFEAATIGIIGDATPTGWDSDTDLTMEAGNEPWLIVNMTCTDGEAKFRMNDDWPVNWGDSAFPTGTGTQDGPNIPVSAGTYDIRFNVNTGEYSFQ